MRSIIYSVPILLLWTTSCVDRGAAILDIKLVGNNQLEVTVVANDMQPQYTVDYVELVVTPLSELYDEKHMISSHTVKSTSNPHLSHEARLFIDLSNVAWQEDLDYWVVAKQGQPPSIADWDRRKVTSLLKLRSLDISKQKH